MKVRIRKINSAALSVYVVHADNTYTKTDLTTNLQNINFTNKDQYVVIGGIRTTDGLFDGFYSGSYYIRNLNQNIFNKLYNTSTIDASHNFEISGVWYY